MSRVWTSLAVVLAVAALVAMEVSRLSESVYPATGSEERRLSPVRPDTATVDSPVPAKPSLHAGAPSPSSKAVATRGYEGRVVDVRTESGVAGLRLSIPGVGP